MKYSAWGLLKEVESSHGYSFRLDKRNLVIGNLRSYGDICLNHHGHIVLSQEFNDLLFFDEKNKTLTAEAGITFDCLLKFLIPKGYFLPVTPGTRFITLGGAVANDVHGKNHHIAGNFGNHVQWLELQKTDQSLWRCSRAENPELFKATIGGMGLTGFIRRVAFTVLPISSSQIETETIKFENLAEFFSINEESRDFPYTVSWVDCISNTHGKAKGRGLYFRGKHSEKGPLIVHNPPKITIPFNLPSPILNPITMRLFNLAYYNQLQKKQKKSAQSYAKFFYPLDSINHWNRIYGKNGFYQFQFVLPFSAGISAFEAILNAITVSREGSFLAVLKTFGSLPADGMMSFPMEGITLALDFQNKGPDTLKLLRRLEAMVIEAGGRFYPAKDAVMSPETFRNTYPQLSNFLKYKDPNITSDFFQRVIQGIE